MLPALRPEAPLFVRLLSGRSTAHVIALVTGASAGCGPASTCDPRFPGDPALVSESTDGMRAALRRHLFGFDGLPDAPPDETTEDVTLGGFGGASRTDRLVFELDYGTRSVVHVLRPTGSQEGSRQRLVLLHAGHQPLTDLASAAETFVDAGFTVALLAMPLYAPNPRLFEVEIDGVGYVVDNHNDLVDLDRAGLRTLQIFLEPVSRTLTHLLAVSDWRQILMVGLSGGGWTTDLYKALDPRLDAGYGVTGSMPFTLRDGPDLGDFEQARARDVYDIADFTELYLLAAEGSRHAQVFFEDDPCCFDWRGRRDQIEAYEADVKGWLDVGARGGRFDVHLLPGATHALSQDVLTYVLDDADRLLAPD